MPVITYRAVTDIEELEQITDLEAAIWGMDARSAVPSNIMSAMLHNGGHANAAFDGTEMVGMALAFPGFEDGQAYLWSHMAGVLPAYQGRGIGLRLKYEQRAWALAHGYREIRWTFDPLQRGNAHFNLALLGVQVRRYLVNIYGTMNDGINAGMPSDRLEAIWRLEEDAVSRLQNLTGKANIVESITQDLITQTDGVSQLHLNVMPDDNGETVHIPIPRQLSSLRTQDHSLVLQWRFAVRAAFQHALSHGYRVAGFEDDGARVFYRLSKVDR